MNGGNLLLTGATGALGPHLLAALLASDSVSRIHVLIRPNGKSPQSRFEELLHAVRQAALPAEPIDARLHRLDPVAGDVTDEAFGEHLADREVEAVIHAAADTRFRASEQEQARVNVLGTQNVLTWAARCPQLKRFVLVSTTCVAGSRTGRIPETLESEQTTFVNAYERTKWHAEQLVQRSGLPSTIVRLSTAIGSERTGSVPRLGAMHHAVRWMHRGLVPMVPGTRQTLVDLISSELSATCVSHIATTDGAVPDVVHVAAGERAIPLGDLLDCAVECFREISPAWRQGQIARPMIVDGGTFELFRDSVCRSGDVLFRAVLDSVASFLPGLLHAKVYETTRAETVLGGPLPLTNWRPLLRRVIHDCVDGDAQRIVPREVCLA